MRKCRSEISLFMRLEPDIPRLTHQHGVAPVHAGGKTFMHKTAEQRAVEAKYCALLRPHAPKEPWNCPTHLSTVWRFRSKSKRGWKLTKPDTDNLVKTLKDCLTRCGFFTDDALVCLESIAKVWVAEDQPHGVEIRLRDISEGGL